MVRAESKNELFLNFVFEPEQMLTNKRKNANKWRLVRFGWRHLAIHGLIYNFTHVNWFSSQVVLGDQF